MRGELKGTAAQAPSSVGFDSSKLREVEPINHPGCCLGQRQVSAGGGGGKLVGKGRPWGASGGTGSDRGYEFLCFGTDEARGQGGVPSDFYYKGTCNVPGVLVFAKVHPS